MTLGADIAARLPELRSEAASRFTETFTVYTPSPDVLDEDTGVITPSETVLYASVRGRIKFPTLTVSEREQGAQTPAVQDVEIHVAVDSTPLVGTNVMWRCTASAMKASYVSRVFRTKGDPQGETADRYPVEQVS